MNTQKYFFSVLLFYFFIFGNVFGQSTPSTPVLLSPSNGATVVPNPLLDWNDVETATHYRVQVSIVANFSTTVIDQVSLTQSRYQVPNGVLSDFSLYFWRARAKNSVGWGPWASAWSFTTTTAPPTTPVLLSPPNGSTTVQRNPLLDWNDVGTATGYRLQVSTVANFTTTVIDQISLDQSQYQVPDGVLSLYTQYYWRARARNAGGWSPWASAWSFTTTIAPPGTPVLLLPLNGSTVQTTPLLDWGDVDYATSYRLQVSTVANFTTTVIDQVSLTQSRYQVPNGVLSTYTQYYWRARARNDGGWGPWASAWSFTTTIAPPSTPVLLLPTNGSTVSPTPLLDWNDVGTATSYRLQVSKVPDFSTTVIDQISLTQSQYQVPNGILSDYSLYYWRARARNDGGWSPWVSAWSFTTTLAAPTIPVLLSPADGSTVSPTPLLDWNDVLTATSYRLQVSELSNFTTTVIDELSLTESQYQVPEGILSTDGQITSKVISKDEKEISGVLTIDNVQYYWRVRARNAGGWSPWVSAWSFTTSLPSIPVLLSPTDGSTVPPTPLLDWEDDAAATTYRLQVSEVANFSTTVIDQISLTQSQYQVPGGILSSYVQYYWRVRGRNSAGWSPWASAWSFTTASTPPATPVLLSPTDGSTVSPTPLLNWNDVDSATSYRLQVSTVANFSTTEIDQVSLTQSQYQVPGGVLANYTQYYWRVRARNSGGWSPWASAWSFTTTIAAPTTPVLLSPADGSTVSPTPLLDWNDVLTATSYRLQVSELSNFTTTVIDELSLTESQYQVPEGILTTDGQIKSKVISKYEGEISGILTVNNVQYYWRVRARNTGGSGPWASAWSFTTSLPTTPVLLSPSNGSTVPPTPLLDWEDAIAATSYRLQVSTDPQFFTTVIDQISLSQSKYKVPVGILSSYVQYYWRARARNSAGWSPWVSAWSFTTTVAPPITPVLLSPANGSTVSTTPLLDWNDVDSATSYRLQVSTDPQFFTTVIDQISLTQSQYQVPGGILSTGTQYYWRARARNAGGWSPWASAWNFTTLVFEGNISGVNIYSSEIPTEFKIYQNFPNPFNPTTKIRFDIASQTKVNLRIYDVVGKEIKTLVDQILQPGRYEYLFNVNNLPSGVYFYRIETGEFSEINKMIILK